MIFLIVSSIVLILLAIFYSFIDFRMKKDLLSIDKARFKQTIIYVLGIITAAAIFVSFIASFSILSTIITGVSILATIIIYFSDRFLIMKNMRHRDYRDNSIIAAVITVLVVLAIIGIYYMVAGSEDDYKLIETNEVCVSDISTEKKNIYFSNESFETPEKVYFAVLDRNPKEEANGSYDRYCFYGYEASDPLSEKTTKITCNASGIKFNFISEGEKPYYKKIEYVYTYSREKDPLMKKKREKIVYEVYIPESEVKRFEKN